MGASHQNALGGHCHDSLDGRDAISLEKSFVKSDSVVRWCGRMTVIGRDGANQHNIKGFVYVL